AGRLYAQAMARHAAPPSPGQAHLAERPGGASQEASSVLERLAARA
ncbi:lipoyl synthase, partial [Rhodococcus hoagii]|nr:lipoyl synthase [Prescottella equi]